MKLKKLRDIKDSDLLGRAVMSNKQKKGHLRSVKSKFYNQRAYDRGLQQMIKAFEDKQSPTNISVDRLNLNNKEIVEIQERRAVSLSNDQNTERTFYGWFRLSVKNAKQNGREVEAQPIKEPRNPYHAIIKFPDKVTKNQKEKKIHINELASYCDWFDKEDALKNILKPYAPISHLTN